MELMRLRFELDRSHSRHHAIMSCHCLIVTIDRIQRWEFTEQSQRSNTVYDGLFPGEMLLPHGECVIVCHLIACLTILILGMSSQFMFPSEQCSPVDPGAIAIIAPPPAALSTLPVASSLAWVDAWLMWPDPLEPEIARRSSSSRSIPQRAERQHSLRWWGRYNINVTESRELHEELWRGETTLFIRRQGRENIYATQPSTISVSPGN